METSFSGSLGLLPAYLKHLYSFLSFLKIFQPLTCKGFRVCSCLLRTFCLLSMNDNKYKSAEDFKVSFIVVKQDLHNVIASLATMPACIPLWYLTYSPLLVSQKIVFPFWQIFYFCVYLPVYIWSPMCGFIAQLVEQRTGNAEVTGLNPVEAPIFFRLLLSNCLNWKIYCGDHSSLSNLV